MARRKARRRESPGKPGALDRREVSRDYELLAGYSPGGEQRPMSTSDRMNALSFFLLLLVSDRHGCALALIDAGEFTDGRCRIVLDHRIMRVHFIRRGIADVDGVLLLQRSEEHTSELQSHS